MSLQNSKEQKRYGIHGLTHRRTYVDDSNCIEPLSWRQVDLETCKQAQDVWCVAQSIRMEGNDSVGEAMGGGLPQRPDTQAASTYPNEVQRAASCGSTDETHLHRHCGTSNEIEER